MAKAGNASGLLAFMRSLSHSDFRTCSKQLGERILPELADSATYWALFSKVVPAHSKAFLGTFLKAAVARSKNGALALLENEALLKSFAEKASAIDQRKTLEALLPAARQTEEADLLLRLFSPREETARIEQLLAQPDTPVICYALFRELRKHDGNIPLLRRAALRLMQKATPNAFKMARIIQAYFGLENLPGTLSLRLEPYELSLLEQGEESFLRMLRK